MSTIIVSGNEIGFGSATVLDSSGNQSETFVDAGFGAPYIITVDSVVYINQNEAGFADPYNQLDLSVEGEDGEIIYVGDNGGTILELRGDFSQIFETFRIDGDKKDKIIGPLKGYFINKSSGEQYNALSGVSGGGTNLFINSNQKQMFLSTPSMLKGDYELKIVWREIFSITLPFDVKVINRKRNDKAMSIRKNLPPYWNAGYRSDNYNNADQYYPRSESNLAVITEIIAENFDSTYDSSYTVTTTSHKIDSNILYVESTLGFDSAGVLILNNGERLTYTGKTSNSFTGITGHTKLTLKDTRVQQEDIAISNPEYYYKFKNYDFYKPSSISNNDFINAFQIVEYNERHSEKVISEYLYHIFKKLNYKRTATITGTTISAPSDGSVWNKSHIQRLCKIDNLFFFIKSGDIDGTGELELDAIGSTYFASADFDGEDYEIEIIPWFITEDSGGLFTVTLEASCFNIPLGFVDKDFIDFNIFIDGDDFDDSIQKNLNLDMFVASGVFERIKFARRSEDNFGTYFVQFAAPDGLKLIPDYEYI